jgi:hypothetical protein
MENLKKQWQRLLLVLFDPWVLILVSLTFGLMVFAIGQREILAEPANSVLLLFTALSSVILGSRFTDRWKRPVEQALLIKKGETAIRNLKLLFSNLTNLENATKKHLSELNGSKENAAGRYYEDMFDLSLMMVKEELIHSIEDWMDIIPDAHLKLHIESLYDLKNALQTSEQRLHGLRKKLLNTKSKAHGELTEEMQAEERRHALIREKILQVKQKLDQSTLCGISGAVLHSNLDRPEAGRAISESVSPLLENLEKMQMVDLPDKANSR